MISLRQISKITTDNSPLVLTVVGVAGVITTAVLSFRAARNVDNIMADELDKMNASGPHVSLNLSPKEEIKATWTCYIPPVVAGSATIASIVMANRIGTKRTAALAAACTITEKAYTEYRDKVVERIGENEERKVRTDIVQDRVKNDPPIEGNVLMVGKGDHLFLEMYTGRYFRSSMEEVKKARNEVNYMINTNGYASVTDFYNELGLAATSESDSVGWTSDKLMDIDFQPVLSEDGQPCVGINFIGNPRPYRFR